MPTTYAPFARPLYVMLKPAGALCNLACDYCYYLEKSKLYQDNPKHVMSDALLEKFIREYIGAQTMPQVLFTWHGGETLMRPLSFYQKAISLQRKYAGGRTIENCIQTNGTMLTDEWCRFFKENNWLVGISIDGPQEFHDEYRKNKQGRPSFVKVMHGIELLNKHGVEWNAMAVVNDFNADYPLEFYRFFKSIGCKYIQFAPIVERILPHADGRHLAAVDEDNGMRLADFSVTPEQWGSFLCTLFDEWVKQDVGEVFIQLFDSTLANWVGEQPGVWRTRRGDGVQRRCLFVRPLCLPAIQVGQHPHADAGGDDVQRASAEVWPRQAGQPAPPVQGVPLALRLQRGVSQEPLCPHGRRRTRAELPLRGLPPLLRPCGALHGLHETGIPGTTGARECDGGGPARGDWRGMKTVRKVTGH